MGLDIFFLEDVANRLDALDQANEDALNLALAFGADRREVRLCRYVYQSALQHVARAFGLHPGLLVIAMAKRRETSFATPAGQEGRKKGKGEI